MEICDRCHKTIGTGELRYMVRIGVAVDDGGEIDRPIDDSEIEALVSHLEHLEPAQLEKGIYDQRAFILCMKCKRAFLKNPLGKATFDPPDRESDYLQ